jgi:sigma-E factor negative regulatory protein RseB
MRTGAATAAIAAARNQAQGMRLLQEAAQSGAVTSYQGVELISDNVVEGNATVVAKVWHSGGVTVTQSSGATALNGSQPYVSYDGDNHDPEGVFGLTTTLVGLLAKNYVPVYEGQGTAVGRPALVVGVRRADGSLAAQFWLDKQTKLPLRRDVYDTQARLVSDDKFVQVSFGQLPVPAAGQHSAARAASPTWTAAPVPVTFLKKLDGQGWHLPVALPGNLDLYAAAETSTTSGRVVDLGFSDGLSVISLFVQRGTLPGAMPGWRPARIGDHAAYVDGHEVTLSAQGYVYTLVADAPAPVMDDAAAALPRQKAPGVLGRIGHGFARLATLANPFK